MSAAFKPMLAGKCEEVQALCYPVMASMKLDGVRAIVMNHRVMSRTLKPIPSAWIQKNYGALPDGTDGELILGDPTDPECYRKTVSAVMSEDGPAGVNFYAFDNYRFDGGFQQRFARLKNLTGLPVGTVIVPHLRVNNADELNEVESRIVEAGHEGAMVRSVTGPYKMGRSTAKEGYLLKVKRFEDAEAQVISVYEWETNNNVAKTNALGRTERSSHQENKVGAGVLGGLNVVGLEEPYKGIEFSIGTGFSGADDLNGERGKLWKARKSLVGKIAKFKYFPLGSKDRPRFPVFLGWRDLIDREVA